MMQSKLTALGILGLIVIAAGLLVWAVQTVLTPYSVTPLILGGVLLLIYVLRNIGFLSAKLSRRNAVEGANLVFGVVIVLAILIFLEMILTRHSTRFDLTEAKKFTLATQSIQAVKTLKEPLTLQYLVNPSTPSETQKAKDLMELYTFYSDKVKTEIIDPEKDPQKVQGLTAVTLNAVYVRKGEKETEHEKVSPVNENNLTNAILKLTKGGGKVIYFTSGHGEHSIEDSTERDGMGKMKGILEEEGYQVKGLSLVSQEEVPDDALAVVIAGPDKPFLETEVQTLQNYMKYGGRIAAFLEPEANTGLNPFLEKDYGIQLGNNWVVEQNPLMRIFGGSPVAPIMSVLEPHPIVDAFGGQAQAVMFPIVQSVRLAKPLPEGVTGTEFIKTSDKSWAETDVQGLRQAGKASFDQGADQLGPIPIAAAVSKPAEEKVKDATEEKAAEASASEPGEEKEKPEARLVVFGDCDFITNKQWMQSIDLFMNTINWMAKREDLISIRPKEDSGKPVTITEVQARFVFYSSLVVLPAFVAVMGTVICVRKRIRG
ncbi:MAG: GldG family protein [bacterium]